ncbi:methylphosphotriester-DNA--protein-cysteine methyltransferase family protein [Cohnella pontilimi]|uniref:Methylphosphotriester-DNA--protein-cysteine methyltransferase family protein n=1 Tax=Cohnella pontilimi TaxID=2564100 RepID=A0A4U0FG70_9BACL|nr:Ada metal-binding domain-containing protein [Cohnella pontilimi]TJY43915.1 methylphosphotriester-DNA--protein-cysteine methyltransferase family protein [Cohnella pontilimi]
MAEKLTESKWRAIVDCDSSQDGTFLYGVSTTGIFCRPSCRSRTPSKENVVIFKDARQAMELKFRPCKRCKPEGIRLPDQQWVDQIADWLESHYAESITLERLAGVFHAGSSHLQRTFKRIRGVSPAIFLQQIRLSKAGELLKSSELTITDIATAAGFTSSAHFATVFAHKMGLTPSQYRQRKADGA